MGGGEGEGEKERRQRDYEMLGLDDMDFNTQGDFGENTADVLDSMNSGDLGGSMDSLGSLGSASMSMSVSQGVVHHAHRLELEGRGARTSGAVCDIWGGRGGGNERNKYTQGSHSVALELCPDSS